MDQLSISVRDMAGIDTLRPVTGGVPLAEGAAPDGVAYALHDENGEAVPLQTSVLARWRDGSARWVLLDFQAAPPPGETRRYTLTWGAHAHGAVPPATVSRDVQETPLVASGDVTLSLTDGTLQSVSERLDILLVLTDVAGQTCSTRIEDSELETAGDLRSTIALRGALQTRAGGRVFQFRLRASLYAGSSLIRLEPLILIDAEEGIIQNIRELKLVVRPRTPVLSARIGGDPEWQGVLEQAVRLLQVDDQHYVMQGTAGRGGQGPGWIDFEDAQGRVAVAMRDFWQQWPKSIEAADEQVAFGLFPRFEEGTFDHMEPWYKHQYLFEGDCYRLRTGQARRWELWVDLTGNGASLAKMANAPLVPVGDPAQAVETGVWDAIAPAGTPEMAEYDPWAENLFQAYCESIRTQRDYGAMNWGDWFGERGVNWGNHEYDTVNQLLIQFARTGDPRYFHVADAAARHSSEVDVVHFVNEDLAAHFNEYWGTRGYPPRAGMVHEHCVGHVGTFYPVETIRALYVERGIGNSPNPYLCLSPFNLGHIWTQGMVRHYFLTGDPFVKETVSLIGANLAQLVEDREYRFMGHSHCGRTTGWTLLALAGAYEMDLDERFLDAMRTLADDALEEQDPICGGWLYSLPRGHCNCEKAKHVGKAGFITSVLINGLARYALLTGDERIPEASGRGVTFLDNDTWRKEWRDWRYTSCPASSRVNQPGVTIMAHVNAVRLIDNPEHLRVLRAAWDAKFKRLLEAPSSAGQGKTYTSTMLGCAEAIGLLAARSRTEET